MINIIKFNLKKKDPRQHDIGPRQHDIGPRQHDIDPRRYDIIIILFKQIKYLEIKVYIYIRNPYSSVGRASD